MRCTKLLGSVLGAVLLLSASAPALAFDDVLTRTALGGVLLSSDSAPARVFDDVLVRPAQAVREPARVVLTAVAHARARLIAVGERGAVIVSDDAGTSWRQARVPVSVSLTSILMRDERRGWATGHSGVVLRTEDGGETWSKVLDGPDLAKLTLNHAVAMTGEQAAQDRGNALRFAMDLASDGPDKPLLDVWFSDDRGLVVGAYGLIFATHDGGRNWTPWMERVDNPEHLHLNAIASHREDLLIVGEQGRVFRSRDGGSTFRRLAFPYAGTLFGVLSCGDAVIVYGLRGHAFRSRDSGDNWEPVPVDSAASLTAGSCLPGPQAMLASQAGDLFSGDPMSGSFRRMPVPQLPPIAALATVSNTRLLLVGIRGVIQQQTSTVEEDRNVR